MNRESVGLRRICIFVCAVAAAWGSAALAADQTLLPVLPPAKGDACVEPTDVMRREHMNFILHQRDLTVHEGIRTEKYRFTNCIDCHVQANAQGEFPRHTSSEHFCTACHEFSAVTIDCFQCHADRPMEALQKTDHSSSARKIKNMLQAIKQP